MKSRCPRYSIVDDDIDITTLFHEAICSIVGISVLIFNDSIKAFEHFLTNPHEYSVILSDNRMPDLNGLDLLRKIKLVKPKVRTILISGFNLQGDDVLEKYLNDGIINKFIQKPMAVSSLRNEVNNQLHTYALSSK